MKKIIFFTILSTLFSNFNINSMTIDPKALLEQAQGISYKKAKTVNYNSFQKIYKACKKAAGDDASFMKKIDGYKNKMDKLKKSKTDARSEFGKMSVYLSLLYLEAKKVVKTKAPKVFAKQIKKQPTIATDKLFSMGAGPLDIKQPADEAAKQLGIGGWDAKTEEIKNESRS